RPVGDGVKRRAHDADLKEMVVIRSPSPQLVPFKLHRFGQQRRNNDDFFHSLILFDKGYRDLILIGSVVLLLLRIFYLRRGLSKNMVKKKALTLTTRVILKIKLGEKSGLNIGRNQ
ncbi:hypothetical protein, partial [Aeromonas caviae]|uniref:hypothetical protein n=1 Tax=Aeromonas caviae TaxID=648 RepID=UPI001F2C6473